ncbi:MAG: rhodanese-like domain-containing protein [Pseudomonadota bacterium]|nr:MAG: rhodanese-like domain-containing protein [Pseudomonadota bacterium]
MKRFAQLVQETAEHVKEIFPWDLAERTASGDLVLLDIREPYEFSAMHIYGSINVPRGILETACEYDYEETVPELVAARERDVVVVCRSGNRSVLAAYTMHLLGYRRVASLKTGLRGWNDFEQPLVDAGGNPVSVEAADEYFTPLLRDDQMAPKG